MRSLPTAQPSCCKTACIPWPGQIIHRRNRGSMAYLKEERLTKGGGIPPTNRGLPKCKSALKLRTVNEAHWIIGILLSTVAQHHLDVCKSRTSVSTGKVF